MTERDDLARRVGERLGLPEKFWKLSDPPIARIWDALLSAERRAEAAERRVEELEEALRRLPLNNFEGDMGSHDAAEFVRLQQAHRIENKGSRKV